MMSMNRMMLTLVWMFGVVASTVAGPVLYVKEPYLRLGDISESIIEHTFAIENRGDALLVIEEIAPGCDLCTTFQIAEREIQPGRTVALKVSIDTSKLKGRFEQYLALHSNAEQDPILFLTVAGNIPSRFILHPPSLSFVTSDGMEVLSDTVLIEPVVELFSPLSKVVSESDRFVARLKKGAKVGTYEIVVKTVPPLREGGTSTNIRVSSTYPDDPECVIAVSVYVQPAFEVLPGRLRFNPVDEEQLRIIFVRQNTDNPVSVLDVLSPLETIHCEIYPEPRQPHYRIYVYGRGLAERDGYRGDLIIKTDDVDRAPINIPIRIRVR